MASLKAKPLNGVEEFDPMERVTAAIELLGKLDRLFIKEWKVRKIRNVKFHRRKPVYFADNKEMFESLFEKHKASNPSLSVEHFQKALKSEIEVLLKAIKPYYHKEGQSEGITNEYDERICRADDYLRWLGKYDPKLKQEKSQTFESLFKDPENAKKVKAFFESRGYTKDGEWIGISGEKKELLAAYYSLRDKSYLKPGKVQPQATIFYKEFGLEVGKGMYITPRSLNHTPNADLIKEFDHIL